jgi:hypothetical protein
MDQLDQRVLAARPNAILDEAFQGSKPDPVQPLPGDLGQVLADFEQRQRQVSESRPHELIQRLDRRQRDSRSSSNDDDDKDQIIRILLNYIHVSQTVFFKRSR